MVQRADAASRDISYGTMPRFLEVFGLNNLDDLPQLADPQRL
jgi:chromosome segregation and condensation protein ScpB